MKLSTKSEYSCLALVYLTRQYGEGRLCTIAEIAREQEIPKKYLEQLLLVLKRARYVKSQKGAEGGYCLAKPPEEITVAEVVRLMDGALAPVESASHYFFEHTPIERCEKLLGVMREIRDFISNRLEKLTFAELV